MLNDKGEYVYEQEEIKALTLAHFQKLFRTSYMSSTLGQKAAASLYNNSNILTSLGNIPNTNKIKSAIFSFKPFKAPGLDGLHPFFYQKYWDMMGPSVINLCTGIFTKGDILDEINENHICLIPKN